MSIFSFCGRMTSSINETAKLHDSKIAEYDVYHNTDPLGYRIVSDDEHFKIRRPRKKNTDNTYQISNTNPNQDNRFSDGQKKSSKQLELNEIFDKKVDMNKINLEVIKPCISKRITDMLEQTEDGNEVAVFVFFLLGAEEYPDARTMLSNLTGILGEKNARKFMKELWMLLIAAEDSADDGHTAILEQKEDELKQRMMVKSKYEYQSDNAIETRDEERIKSRTQYLLRSAYEKSIEMLKSQYKYQHDDDDANQTHQDDKFDNKIQDVSRTSSRTVKEPSRHYTSWIDYNTHLPVCASSSAKCARCGEEVLQSDFKQHVLVKCSKISGKDPLGNRKPSQRYVIETKEKSDSGSLCHKLKSNILVSETDLLCKHLKDLYTNENCWDAVIQVEDKEFKVHRAILSARSSVFSAMFQHETAEKQTGIVKISDCNADSFKLFLEYLYTGKLEDVSSKSVIHLYTISDKYDVQELKTSCTKYLAQNIAIQNISEVVILADEYDEEKLFSDIQDFFNKNVNEIVLTKEWENLLKCNYRLANKLLIGKSKADRGIK